MVVVVGYNNPVNANTPGVQTMNNGVWTGSQLSQYQVAISGANYVLQGATPSATVGVPLISQGAAANPAFGTAVVAGGGTGQTSFTAFAPITGGTTSTGAMLSANTRFSVSGNVLMTNGSAASPTWETLATVGGITQITGNSGGAQVPLAGNFNILGTGSVTSVGTANTETIQLTGLTNHNVLVGAGTATVTKVAPSATSGVPFISQGASADPLFGTAVVAGGGTGATTFTAYAPVCGGGTSLLPLQSATAGFSTTGNVFSSNGASAIPGWSSLAGLGATTSFTCTSGSATPAGGVITLTGTANQMSFAGSGSTITGSLTSELSSPSLVALGGSTHFTALGASTGSNTAATDATFVGYQAGQSVSTGTANTAVGSEALMSLTTQFRSTAIGFQALQLSQGNSNTATGYRALASTVSGINATAYGYTALGSYLVNDACAFGYQSLTALTSGTGNCAFGINTGLSITTGTSNSIFGFNAMSGASATAAAGNSIFGAEAGIVLNASSIGNSGIGYQTLHSATSAQYNVAAGNTSLANLTTGQFNIGIGLNAGTNYTSSESSNIVIGSPGVTSESNALRIGSSTGTGAGQTNSAAICGISGKTSSGGVAVLINGSDVLGTTTSSIRYKENIQPILNSQDVISRLNPISFTYKNDPAKCQEYGLIAESVEKIIPDWVVYDKEGLPDNIRYQHLPIFLLAQMQKMMDKIEYLHDRIAALGD